MSEVGGEKPRPSFVRERPFVRGDFGIDQDAVVAGKTIREFVSVVEPWGATLELQRQSAAGGWETLSSATLAAAATGGAWIETPATQETVTATYRCRLLRGEVEVVSQERAIRHVNPRDYTGLAAEVYALIAAVRPDTIIDVVDHVVNPLNPHAVAQAHHGYDRLEVAANFAEGGAARGDLRAVVLHELGHLIQWDAYGGNAQLMSDHLTAVFGPKQPLELSANCLCEHWGGLEPGNHYPCFEGEAIPCTETLARGEPYWARSLGAPTQP